MMGATYNQRASHVKRQSQSSTNASHTPLAPLTTKMPLTEAEPVSDVNAPPYYHNPSYLQGKSAPTTPRLLQSPPVTRPNSPRRRASLTDSRGTAGVLNKSKSTTHIHMHKGDPQGDSGPSHIPWHRREVGTRGGSSDWMLRTGALISLETRESKGQAWLVSRASSTSLTGVRDVDEEIYERELARERELASRRQSRRSSASGLEGGLVSPGSRYGSRPHSRMGNRSQLRSPLEPATQDGHFNQELTEVNIPGPDFVGLDEKLEALRVDTNKTDEATIRRLVVRRNGGVGAWMWSLFAVEENDEDSDNANEDLTDGETDDHIPRSASTFDFERFSCPPESRIPPPKETDGTGWEDAAWLLNVASKVLL
ncbi:hypothetical protein GGS21DRAFT_501089 [Xylaria nigripes]|nr:hypothetical protein GGS21DRAFT_501089 [Xylaria nigripes]